MTPDDSVTAVTQLLQRAERLLFITGAGISADSGLPTYRGVSGLYENQNAADGLPIEVALSGAMFDYAPEITWKYIWQVGQACIGAKPNDAHRCLADLESRRADVWVITQNVDGLHRTAGSKNLVEVHGHAFDLYCTRCGRTFLAQDLIGDYATPVDLPPHCPDCGGIVRPDVVLFGEALSPQTMLAFSTLATTPFDAVVSIGTSSIFPYISGYVLEANRAGIPTVEINPATTELSEAFTYRLPMPAVAAVRALGLV